MFAAVVVLLIYLFWKKIEFTFENTWLLYVILGALLLVFCLRLPEIMQGLCALLVLSSLGLSISLNYFRCTTDTEPYVYVQTYNDVFKLSRPLLALAQRDPLCYQLVGHFIRTSSYPFPWMLGDFSNVGYYEHNNSPDKMDADFLLVQEDRIEEVEAKLTEIVLHRAAARSALIRTPRKFISTPNDSVNSSPIALPISSAPPRKSRCHPNAMKWLSAGLVFVAATTVCALLIGLAGHGLGCFAAWLAGVVGVLFAFAAYIATNDQDPHACEVFG